MCLVIWKFSIFSLGGESEVVCDYLRDILNLKKSSFYIKQTYITLRFGFIYVEMVWNPFEEQLFPSAYDKNVEVKNKFKIFKEVVLCTSYQQFQLKMRVFFNFGILLS